MWALGLMAVRRALLSPAVFILRLCPLLLLSLAPARAGLSGYLDHGSDPKDCLQSETEGPCSPLLGWGT